MNRADDAGHLGAQRRKIAADVRIISYLFDVPAFPTIPVASDGDENCQGERHNKEGSHVLFPFHPAARSSRRLVAFWRQGLRHGGGGFSRYWRSGHQICSFSSKKSASAALFVTELLRPLCLSKLIHAEAIGSVCFSISDMTLHIDHRADAAVELKEGRCFLSGQDSSKDRHIALAQFC